MYFLELCFDLAIGEHVVGVLLLVNKPFSPSADSEEELPDLRVLEILTKTFVLRKKEPERPEEDAGPCSLSLLNPERFAPLLSLP